MTDIKKLDPDKLKAWRTSAAVEIYKELPHSKVPIPSEDAVEIAKKFVEENKK